MAWIESHQSLRGHPKTEALMDLLGISRTAVIGHLHCLWWWALDYAQDGDLSGYTSGQIARAADWQDDPNMFVEALVSCGRSGEPGFLERDQDGSLVIHDWSDYAGRLIAKRKADTDRKRRARESDSPPASDGRPADSSRTPSGHPTDGAGTVPNHTVPNLTIPTEPNQPILPPPPVEAAPPDAVSGSDPQGAYPEAFAAFWALYPRKTEKRKALKAWRTRLKERLESGPQITPELLVQAAASYAERCRRTGTEERYIKHPASFLSRDHPFAEYLAAQTRGGEHLGTPTDPDRAPVKDWYGEYGPDPRLQDLRTADRADDGRDPGA